MKNSEFYKKYKTTYPPSSKFSREDWWQLIVISIAAVLIEPFVIYKNRHTPFTLSFYVEQIQYFLWIGIPYALYYFWNNWQASVKRSRGYRWVGKFEVIRKRSSFFFCYLILAPGKANTVMINRSLFSKIREGDFVMIHKDALGKIEQVIRVKDFATRLTRIRSKPSDPDQPK